MDHYPILCKIDESKSNNSNNLPDEYYRDKSKFTAKSFCEDLEKSWNPSILTFLN